MSEKKPAKTAAERQAAYRAKKQQKQPEAEQPGGTLPVIVYQHRVRELETQVHKLEEDKLRLYDLLEAAQENVQREQSLRLLSEPVADRGPGLAWWGRVSQWWRRG